MLQNDFSPKVKRELAVLNVLLPLFGLVICSTVIGFYFWRLHHFERATATVEAVWYKEVLRRDERIVAMGELSFIRTASNGEIIQCRHSFEIGTPSDDFKIGDKLEIIPATGTCQRADIIGRSQPER